MPTTNAKWDSSEFPSLIISQDDQLLTVALRAPEQMTPDERRDAEVHWELGELFSRLRGADDIRVIVVTGAQDGVFFRPLPTSEYEAPEKLAKQNDPERNWQIFSGITRFHESITSIEKPVIARVNGDAIGFGQSVMFACDLIVAHADAHVRDNHMELGERGRGSPYGLVPGDGGLAFVPAYMSPAKAKEYLMLAKEYTGAELAAMGVINYAVAPDELDAVVGELVSGLLGRAAYALAWTKRLANRAVVSQMLSVLDAAGAYEMVNFLQAERANWVSPTRLR